MSVQEANRRKLSTRIIRKLRFYQMYLRIRFFFERLLRAFNTSDIFFDYHYEAADAHPFFKRYYQLPPTPYANETKAQIAHFIHHPKFIDNRPFIIEPNDHPLAPLCRVEPIENTSGLEIVHALYSRSNCRKIIVESPGQMRLFQHYFPDERILNKCQIIPIGAVPKQVDWQLKFNRLQRGELNFLCLVSDFNMKGADLIIDAWLNFVKLAPQARLWLVCTNVPEEYLAKIRIPKNRITFIGKAPLTEKVKQYLFSQVDISLAPLHTDGGANIVESFENGVGVITFRSQRSEGQIVNGTGHVIDVPYYYYDPEHYGITWLTMQDFFKKVREDKSRGLFESVSNGVFNQLLYYSENATEIFDMCVRAYQYSAGDFSLWKRNAQLVRLYAEIR